MSKASDKALGELHASLARKLKDAIEQDYTSEDNPKGIPPAQLLNVARGFLKDNNITADVTVNTELRELADLPVFDDADFDQRVSH